MSSIDANSLERMVPEQVAQGDVTGSASLALHLERYQFAAQWLQPGRVLDIACGVGYGTRLLRDSRPAITEAVGVDICAEVVAYARHRYQTAGMSFFVDEAVGFTPEQRFENVVSLETIEHLPDPNAYLEHVVRRLVLPGGILVASVPTTPTTDVNPFHLHDFTQRSFRKMFARHGFTELGRLLQVQRFKVLRLLKKEEARARDLRSNLLAYYVTHPLQMFRRACATLRYGFRNHYFTVALRAPK
jgi:2-polyprenyl-3-methyl-5-hydroxy-6-metoxy-1,4-benzoquinol methylase